MRSPNTSAARPSPAGSKSRKWRVGVVELAQLAQARVVVGDAVGAQARDLAVDRLRVGGVAQRIGAPSRLPTSSGRSLGERVGDVRVQALEERRHSGRIGRRARSAPRGRVRRAAPPAGRRSCAPPPAHCRRRSGRPRATASSAIRRAGPKPTSALDDHRDQQQHADVLRGDLSALPSQHRSRVPRGPALPPEPRGPTFRLGPGPEAQAGARREPTTIPMGQRGDDRRRSGRQRRRDLLGRGVRRHRREPRCRAARRSRCCPPPARSSSRRSRSLLGPRVPRRALAVLGPLGAAMIGVAIATTTGYSDSAVLYMWPARLDGVLLRHLGHRRSSSAGSARARRRAALAAAPRRARCDRWIDVVVAVLVVAGVVRALAARNERLVDQLVDEARVDPLTGLLNRRGLEERMEAEIARAAREGTPLGAVVFDLDHFKASTTTHGHELGDRVLVWLGALLEGAGARRRRRRPRRRRGVRRAAAARRPGRGRHVRRAGAPRGRHRGAGRRARAHGSPTRSADGQRRRGLGGDPVDGQLAARRGRPGALRRPSTAGATGPSRAPAPTTRGRRPPL